MNMSEQATKQLTVAQAVIAFLKNQYVERDGREQPFFAGCFGIFGHGNVAGIGQALQQMPEFRYYQARNEQAMVHIATAYAKTRNRLQTFACTSSIGPGATNMVTGAATATINRLPVLLLPGDIFARRNVAPVLQQLESEHTQDISVNDCFRPVSRERRKLSDSQGDRKETLSGGQVSPTLHATGVSSYGRGDPCGQYISNKTFCESNEADAGLSS